MYVRELARMLFAREPAKVEVLNDINRDLINLYRVVQHHLEEFVRQFRWALTSREMFRWAQLGVGDSNLLHGASSIGVPPLMLGMASAASAFDVAMRQRRLPAH
jgi:hypothetical protein